jgi:phosphatidylinositol phospholipase C epsilon
MKFFDVLVHSQVCSICLYLCLQFISDYNGEDHYFTRIGPGGLINLDKIYRTQAVMDRIASFHQHYHARGQESAHNVLRDQLR